jgi:uncharacterized membrane protein YoaK (UPF0700 family)
MGTPADPPVELVAGREPAEAATYDHDRKHLWLMLALTFGTGMIDAIGYLGLDRVFTGNMTGNVVILGMALAGADDLPVLGPLLALLGFMAGAAIAGRTLPSKTYSWRPRFSWILAVNAVAMTACAIALIAVEEAPTTVAAATITTALAMAMGLQAGMARVVAVRDVTTVVVTSTITSLASDSMLGANRRTGAGRRIASIALITVGALVGALLVHWHLSAGLLLAAVLSLGVAVCGATIGPRSRG